MVIALVLLLSLAALGYCIWLLRKMAMEILSLRSTLKILTIETQTLSSSFESVTTLAQYNLTKSATKTTTKKPRARVR